MLCWLVRLDFSCFTFKFFSNLTIDPKDLLFSFLAWLLLRFVRLINKSLLPEASFFFANDVSELEAEPVFDVNDSSDDVKF